MRLMVTFADYTTAKDLTLFCKQSTTHVLATIQIQYDFFNRNFRVYWHVSNWHAMLITVFTSAN